MKITAILKYTVYLVYTFALVYLVFIKGDDHRHLSLFSLNNHINWVPGKEKYRFFTNRDLWPGHNFRFYIIEIVANFFLLTPVPVFLILFEGFSNIKKVIVTGLLISLAIETLQFILGIGSADIDDLILNTLGVAISAFVCTWINSTFLVRSGRT